MVLSGREVEEDAVLEVAKLMLISARTAPKGRGFDEIISSVVTDEKEALAAEMEKFGKFKDAASVRQSRAVVLIGLRNGARNSGNNCGACGFTTCDEMVKARKVRRDFIGPNCAIRLLDLGIAIGSAAKTASILNVDNRIMFTAGKAAKRLNLLGADVILGIPLSVSSKSIYFDRKEIDPKE